MDYITYKFDYVLNAVMCSHTQPQSDEQNIQNILNMDHKIQELATQFEWHATEGSNKRGS